MMRIPFTRALLLLLIPVGCTSTNGDSSFKKNTKAPVYITNASELLPLLKEGDIILRQGEGPFSTAIVKAMGEKNRVSHCGIVVKLSDSLVVAQSISEELSGIDGMQLQSIQSFMDDTADSNLFVMRYKQPEINKAVSKEAIRLLNKSLPFDHWFILKDTNEIYCAELPYRCFSKLLTNDIFIYKPMEENKLIKFDSFFQKKYFEEVYAGKPIHWIK